MRGRITRQKFQVQPRASHYSRPCSFVPNNQGQYASDLRRPFGASSPLRNQNRPSASAHIPDVRLQDAEHSTLAQIFRVLRVRRICKLKQFQLPKIPLSRIQSNQNALMVANVQALAESRTLRSGYSRVLEQRMQLTSSQALTLRLWWTIS